MSKKKSKKIVDAESSDWMDLNGKVLEIVVFEEDGQLMAGGIDVDDGTLYIFAAQDLGKNEVKH